jgi:GTP-binding protein
MNEKMIIKAAEFIKSAANPSHYPAADLPEVAFGGRSNVGKSSLINSLLNRKHLVKTGSTPGRTQLINFFLINSNFYFVDLPGYGYAKVPQRIRKQWGPMVEKYISQRTTLKGIIFLLDIRRKPSDGDLEFHNWLNYYRIPVIFVITKSDKLSKSNQMKQSHLIAQELQVDLTDLIRFSAKTRQGREAIWDAISKVVA